MKEANQILALLSNVNRKMANKRLNMCTIYADVSIKRLKNGDCQTFMMGTTADL
jgi:hypothetical protein